MAQTVRPHVVGVTVLAVAVLAGMAWLVLNDGPSVATIGEAAACQARAHEWVGRHGAFWRAAGRPLFTCTTDDYAGWHAQFIPGSNTIEVVVQSRLGDEHLAHLSRRRFYDGIFWHETAHAYGDATGSWSNRRVEYSRLRPKSTTGKSPVEDYALSLTYSIGHYDSWDSPTPWRPPDAAELEVLRARGFFPRAACSSPRSTGCRSGHVDIV